MLFYDKALGGKGISPNVTRVRESIQTDPPITDSNGIALYHPLPRVTNLSISLLNTYNTSHIDFQVFCLRIHSTFIIMHRLQLSHFLSSDVSKGLCVTTWNTLEVRKQMWTKVTLFIPIIKGWYTVHYHRTALGSRINLQKDQSFTSMLTPKQIGNFLVNFWVKFHRTNSRIKNHFSSI